MPEGYITIVTSTPAPAPAPRPLYATRQWAGCASCGCLIIREDPTRIWSHAANRKGDGTDCHNLVVAPYLTQQQVEHLQVEVGRRG
jgi:hypothetical protein